MLEPGGALLDDLGEGVLRGGTLLDRETPPRRIDAVEGVGNVLAVHESQVTAVCLTASALGFASPPT